MRYLSVGPPPEVVCILTRRGRRRLHVRRVAELLVGDLFAPRPTTTPDPRQSVLPGELSDPPPALQAFEEP